MRRCARGGLRALAAALVLTMVAPASGWAADLPKTYLDDSFGTTLDNLPTSYEQQDKLWFHDDAWWALMYYAEDGSSRVSELLPDHTWRPTDQIVNSDPSDLGDALRDEDAVYVVSRGREGGLQFRRLDYDDVDRTYLPAAAGPVLITTEGARAPASIAKDTTGRLWVSFATATEVLVTYSDDDGTTWTQPFQPQLSDGADVPPGQTSAVVAFGTKIGVMWSDQSQDRFRFAVHADGAPDDEWSGETPLAGLGMSDNHISVKPFGEGPDATLLAAVKTSQGDKGEPGSAPLVMVLKRKPDGTWTAAVGSTVGDRMDSPHLQIDESNATVYLLTYGRGGVYGKQSPIRDLAFEPGRGTPFAVTGRATLADPTGSKHPVDAYTGLVVLASGTGNHRYSHSELALPGTPTAHSDNVDVEAPAAPEELLAQVNDSGNVIVSWSASTDGDRWAAASDGVPVDGYTVSRDGVELGSTDRTSFADSELTDGSSHEYAVRAVDRAGNVSTPTTVTVHISAQRDPSRLPVRGLAGLLVGLAGVVVLLAIRRRRMRAEDAFFGTDAATIVPPGRGPSIDAGSRHGAPRRVDDI